MSLVAPTITSYSPDRAPGHIQGAASGQCAAAGARLGRGQEHALSDRLPRSRSAAISAWVTPPTKNTIATLRPWPAAGRVRGRGGEGVIHCVRVLAPSTGEEALVPVPEPSAPACASALPPSSIAACGLVEGRAGVRGRGEGGLQCAALLVLAHSPRQHAEHVVE